MWPFNKKKRERELIKKAFKKHLDTELVDRMCDDPAFFKIKNNKTRSISYILISINQNNDFHNTLSNLIDYSIEKKASIDTIAGVYVKIIYGSLPFYEVKDINLLHQNYINELPEHIKRNCAILHGTCNCYVGNIGNNSRMTFSALLPDYKMKLLKLFNCDYGHIIEDN